MSASDHAGESLDANAIACIAADRVLTRNRIAHSPDTDSSALDTLAWALGERLPYEQTLVQFAAASIEAAQLGVLVSREDLLELVELAVNNLDQALEVDQRFPGDYYTPEAVAEMKATRDRLQKLRLS